MWGSSKTSLDSFLTLSDALAMKAILHGRDLVKKFNKTKIKFFWDPWQIPEPIQFNETLSYFFGLSSGLPEILSGFF